MSSYSFSHLSSSTRYVSYLVLSSQNHSKTVLVMQQKTVIYHISSWDMSLFCIFLGVITKSNRIFEEKCNKKVNPSAQTCQGSLRDDDDITNLATSRAVSQGLVMLHSRSPEGRSTCRGCKDCWCQWIPISFAY